MARINPIFIASLYTPPFKKKTKLLLDVTYYSTNNMDKILSRFIVLGYAIYSKILGRFF